MLASNKFVSVTIYRDRKMDEVGHEESVEVVELTAKFFQVFRRQLTIPWMMSSVILLYVWHLICELFNLT
jgi:hypothetical protein